MEAMSRLQVEQEVRDQVEALSEEVENLQTVVKKRDHLIDQQNKEMAKLAQDLQESKTESVKMHQEMLELKKTLADLEGTEPRKEKEVRPESTMEKVARVTKSGQFPGRKRKKAGNRSRAVSFHQGTREDEKNVSAAAAVEAESSSLFVSPRGERGAQKPNRSGQASAPAKRSSRLPSSLRNTYKISTKSAVKARLVKERVQRFQSMIARAQEEEATKGMENPADGTGFPRSRSNSRNYRAGGDSRGSNRGSQASSAGSSSSSTSAAASALSSSRTKGSAPHASANSTDSEGASVVSSLFRVFPQPGWLIISCCCYCFYCVVVVVVLFRE